MKLYTVIEEPQKGKTTLIKKIAKQLAQSHSTFQIIGAEELTEEHAFNTKDEFWVMVDHLDKEISTSNDIINSPKLQTYEAKGIIEIDGKKIGIYTSGDAEYYLRDAICFFMNHHCDIGLHAARQTTRHRKCICAMCKLYQDQIDAHDLLKENGYASSKIKYFTDDDVAKLANSLL